VLEAALLKINLRGNISNRTKQLCAYCDDVVIIARTLKALKEKFIKLHNAAERLRLTINTNKTKYMQLTRKTSTKNHDFVVSGKSYETVDRFM
jgi:hypothetical protein